MRAEAAGALEDLAQAFGVLTWFKDAFGKQRHASPEALVIVLRILGAEMERPEDAPAALRSWEAETWRRVVEPVVVAWDGRLDTLALRVPAGAADVRARIRVDGEDGSWSTGATVDLATSPAAAGGRAGGLTFVEKVIRLPARDFGRLPSGYHRLSVEPVGVPGEHVATVLAAPERCAAAPQEAWGSFLPLYALRRAGDWGVGDVRGLRDLMEWTNGLGGRTFGTLPLYASFLGPNGPFQPSPYAPVSTLFWNELYADVPAAPEYALSAEAQQEAGSADFRREASELHSVNLVDYRRVMALRRRILGPLARAAHEDPARRAWLERATNQHSDLDDYARFRAAVERSGTTWRAWPSRQREGMLGEEDVDAGAFRYHRYVQALMDDQLEALPRDAAAARGLLLDLPLGVHPDGYDVWRDRAAFAEGASLGAPPDTFFLKGQNWGTPPPHREHARRSGYRTFRRRLRTAMGRAAALRADHILGLNRMYWIPDGFPAVEGVYVRYPVDELFAVLSIESNASGAPVVGEDLGTVPPEVRGIMARHGVLRTYVVELELWPGRRPALPNPPAASLATLNTHDLPPFAAYVEGRDIDDRARIGLLDAAGARAAKRRRARLVARLRALLRDRELLGTAEDDLPALFRAALAFVTGSGASLALVNLEDLWGERLPQNLPGTGDEEPNWRRKARLSFEEFTRSPEVLDALSAVDEQRRAADAEAAVP